MSVCVVSCVYPGAKALYMGVPVVTMRGGSHAHNVGASLLTAVGLTECITRSEDDYVATCARLAANPTSLAAGPTVYSHTTRRFARLKAA